jgi:hypothetical protein
MIIAGPMTTLRNAAGRPWPHICASLGPPRPAASAEIGQRTIGDWYYGALSSGGTFRISAIAVLDATGSGRAMAANKPARDCC